LRKITSFLFRPKSKTEKLKSRESRARNPVAVEDELPPNDSQRPITSTQEIDTPLDSKLMLPEIDQG
jgi:hypothetical protein